MNSVQIMGNLTRDPQMRATKTGKSVASFSVAVNRQYTLPTGEQRELTDFVNVVAWGSLAEAVGNQLRKGTRVFVEGRFTSRSYETQSGEKRYVSEVNANFIALPIGIVHAAQPSQDMGGFAQPSGFNQSNKGNFNQFGSSKTDEDIPF